MKLTKYEKETIINFNEEEQFGQHLHPQHQSETPTVTICSPSSGAVPSGVCQYQRRYDLFHGQEQAVFPYDGAVQ